MNNRHRERCPAGGLQLDWRSLGQEAQMLPRRVLLFDVNRILLFDVNRIFRFDLNRILTWDIGLALQRPVSPILLKALAGWFLYAILLDITDVRHSGIVLVAAMGVAFVLP